jgi:uncharacterized protein (TIGR03435 family)
MRKLVIDHVERSSIHRSRAQRVLPALMGGLVMCLAATVGLGEQSARSPRPSAPPVATLVELAQAVPNPATAAAAPQEPRSAVSAQPLAFDVASVKTAVPPEREPVFCIVPCAFGERLTVVGSRVDIRFMSLHTLMVTAYRIKPYQLSGPDWMRSQRFDIAAKIPDGVSKDRVPEMLQALLAERFKLSIHPDSKEQPVYALVVGKNGSKLRESTAEADAPVPETPGSRPLYTPQGDARMLENGGFVVTGGAYGPMRGGRGPNGGMKIEFLKLTMPGLAEVLAPHVDRPVVDMTNLKGGYYFASENQPPSGGGGSRGGGARKGGPPEGGHVGGDGADSGPPPDPFGEALFTAIENAGLKLEARKAPVEMIVVDHLAKTPTEN